MADQSTQLIEVIEYAQNFLIAFATGKGGDRDSDRIEYRDLRRQLLDVPTLRDKLPQFVHTCRTSDEFWGFIKLKFAHYSERRQYIWDEFRPAFEFLEATIQSPPEQSISDLLKNFDEANVHHIWSKALERRTDDPEGAITAARTLLETVCKHILDLCGTVYPDDTDLPGLYKMVSKQLNIAPSQHSEDVFKQILGGCTSVVGGLGAMRNRLSDAHGKGRKPVKPAARHAQLAVNLAGTMATFLVQTWIARTS